MRRSQMTNRTAERDQAMEGSKKDADKASGCFYSVEFSVEGLKLLYQSRIWTATIYNGTTASMFALVKENSDILKWIQAGDVLNMKYYSSDSMCPTRNFDTKIEYIRRDPNGRFKGNYLVGLEILPAPGQSQQPREPVQSGDEWGHAVRKEEEIRSAPVFDQDALFAL